MLVGLWAATQLGLPEHSRTIYALEVTATGLMGPAPDDIVDKIARDFMNQGLPIGRGEILVQIAKTHRLVSSQVIAMN
jgi:hypothetical protein